MSADTAEESWISEHTHKREYSAMSQDEKLRLTVAGSVYLHRRKCNRERSTHPKLQLLNT